MHTCTYRKYEYEDTIKVSNLVFYTQSTSMAVSRQEMLSQLSVTENKTTPEDPLKHRVH